MLRPAVTLLAAALLLPGLLPAQRPARDLLAQLSLEAQAGQLFMCWMLSTDDGSGAARAKMVSHVKDLGLGGVILSTGSAADARRLALELQLLSRVPLLVAADFESGLFTRLSGTTALGYPMLLGATGSAALAREHGRVTGAEARALGFDLVFAPDLDVNSNPLNPIINVRSFGEDPQAVARLGAAFVEGLQSTGAIATGKHFPGHGDTVADSHLELPVVPGDRAALEKTSLLPFRAAIKAGLGAVMSGHLTVEGLGVPAGRSATLTPAVMTDLLRRELGFQGLAVTDALDMQAITRGQPPGEAAVLALLAGADLLLMPTDPVAARDAVVAAVRAGRVPKERFEAAVLAVLSAKECVGLLRGKAGGRTDWPAVVGDPRHAALAREVARRGITLVRDDAGLVPLGSGGRVTVLNVVPKPESTAGTVLVDRLRSAPRGLKEIRLHPGSLPAEWEAAARAAAECEHLIVAVHLHFFDVGREVELKAVRPLNAILAKEAAAVVVMFGDPYLLHDLAAVPTAICAFDSTEPLEGAVADALLGQSAFTGRLPVTIPGVAAKGDGVSLFHDPAGARPETRAKDLAGSGFTGDLAVDVRQLLERAVEDHAFPGAVAIVSRRGDVACEVAVGHETYDAASPAVTGATRYDLASLTKVCATLPVVARLLAQKKLDLDQKVATLVPAFSGGGKDAVTLRHLLVHAAGLPPFRKFYAQLKSKAAIVEAAAKEPLEYEPGAKSVYSDLGLILLMACVEKVTGEPFDVVVSREVLVPLGMTQSGFAPTGTPIEAAPTESCAWRGQVVRGQVHDENAYAMGGVSGHAGLFATARDVARIGHLFLGGGAGGYLPGPLVSRIIRRDGLVAGSSRGLLWDTFTPGGSGGSRLSPRAFGHTGFTGTSIWCDPATDLCVVLLTNRVHPSRDNNRIAGVRRALADLVADRVEGARIP